jgi:hypothetical protein
VAAAGGEPAAVGHCDLDAVRQLAGARHTARHEDELQVAFAHLMDVSAGRPIVAVPYETTPQPLYGHRQVFTPESCARGAIGVAGA